LLYFVIEYRSMTVRAYAKINLGLRILRKRPDGYHDIETIFHQIDNYDTIEFTRTEGDIALESNSATLPTDSANLCVKAAQLLQNISHVKEGVKISLTKNIPVGAGLGGGSSDAAATLKGLVKLWGLALRNHELKKIALNLGSDVPFFLEGGTAFATGRGDNLEHFPFELPYWILVATPPVQVSTSWAYSQVQSYTSTGGLRAIVDNTKPLFELMTNDLETVVFKAYPEVSNLKKVMSDLGAESALMSGSGSSVFAFFQEEDSANIAALKLSKSYDTSLTPPSFKPAPPTAGKT
jgi:4-diphosphocytidyl-2-C-methyl-D-erythritol kinase